MLASIYILIRYIRILGFISHAINTKIVTIH